VDTCPVCQRSLSFHTDRECVEGRSAQVAAICCILRNLTAVPYREFATSQSTTVVAIAMSYEQFEALKRFAESD
jgi:hypothetical protein